MAVAFTNAKGWAVNHQYFTVQWTLSGGSSSFDCAIHGLRTVEAVTIQDTAALTDTPYWSVSGGVVTVTGVTANGTGYLKIDGEPG